ncbi:GNAT family N-acetyltransferase [Pseudobdellovibrio exovorus]|uniref:N-acetyltransferase domain-containing protein n=1 Tax=Pseudobdellovibrio exovorus JSS TaxID=1184267 RepID=M4V9F1_9BACT|nr:GNAT family N-acetyltransferase [Pseudobdellovibrio exovorus]AGH94656.1 hypothetical protein A11Q_436 [Pseudobdellovibrio exovorus JSS]
MTSLLTRFFRHYKNKPYKYLGVARHSETLEELALYESLYDNQLGRIWVRPKDMFFESIELDGKSRPRFEQVRFDLVEKTQIDDGDWDGLAEVYQEGFQNELSRSKVSGRLTEAKNPSVLFLYDQGKLVAFKVGYAKDTTTYYSWIGAVRKDYRGLGLATELMKAQHDWCKKQGYTKIQTKSRNQFAEMLRLNIKFGFEITDVVHEANGKSKIIMEKTLTT